MKTILSFDQAAQVSGWSYWENGKPVKWGVITPKPKGSIGGPRLTSLRKQFKQLIEELNPDLVLLENPVGGEEDKTSGPENNWKTMQVLCQVQGILLQVIDELDKSHEIISPSEWQNTCGIHKRWRAERKEGARKFVEREYGLTESDVSQDEVDSMCIAYHYLAGDRYERSIF